MLRPLALALLGLALLLPGDALAARWTVSVESLAPVREQTSQPLSVLGVVIHDERVDVWEPGRFARRAVWAIAEDGDPLPLIETYRGRRGVGVADGPGPGIFPGERRTFTFRRVPRRYDRISIVQMLGNTNDAFTGVDSLRLPLRRGAVIEAGVWDAGSERNSQLREFVPGPCCRSLNARDPERRRIRRHRGILPYGDLDPAVHGWSGPIVRYSIRRTR
jgi:hypothetical protein